MAELYLVTEAGVAILTEAGQRILLEQSGTPAGGGGVRSRAPKPRPQPKIIRVGYDDQLPQPVDDAPVIVDVDATLERLLAIPAPYRPPAPLGPLPTSDDELILLLS